MLTFVKDDFDENTDDILNSINKMIAKNKEEKNKEENKAREENDKNE